jgi:hypothetical protein
MDLRAEAEAVEAREAEAKKTGVEAEEDEDLGDLDAAEPVEAEEAAPTKKKARAKKTPGPAKPRKKKTVAARMRIVWVVLDNSSKPVATFDYNKRAEADAYAEKMKVEKKSTYFVQPKKEAMPE